MSSRHNTARKGHKEPTLTRRLLVSDRDHDLAFELSPLADSVQSNRL